MGLTRVNIGKNISKIDRTSKEWQDKCDRIWEDLQKHGTICITNPSGSGTRNIIEELKKNPNAIMEYDSNIPFDEFYAKVLNGNHDER